MEQAALTKLATDEELAVGVASGSRAAFEELVYRYSPRLFHFLRHRLSTNQDIEDLIQDTFLKAYRNIDRYNPEFKFSTWLYTVAMRLAISHYRANKPKDLSSIPNHEPLDPEEIVTRKDQSQKMWIIARSLHNKQYEVLWLRYMEDMAVKEIALVMNKTQVQVRVLLHRARLNLGKKLNKSIHLTEIRRSGSVKHKYSFL
ncbi:MAG: sigma-70 family RNA polymerase sigma factor [Candidatus Aminicenantes bacterium]|jgi:RNA polymerase sigma-70 factor (ECF subfamily)